MALVIRQPTSTQTPDATLGGNAVTGITNTGHGSTDIISSANGSGFDQDEKSARWFGLVNVSGTRTDVRLKLSWQVEGLTSASDDGVGGSGEGHAAFAIEYTLNGGSNWTTIVADSADAFSPGSGTDGFTNNNSANISLPLNQDISQVQVRVDYETSAVALGGLGNSGGGQVSATSMSGIQVEVTTVDSNMIVMM